MTTENSAVTDGVSAELNAPETGPEEGTKGPDPAQHGENAEHADTGFEPSEGTKGPDPAQWGDEARAERGAEAQGPASLDGE